MLKIFNQSESFKITLKIFTVHWLCLIVQTLKPCDDILTNFSGFFWRQFMTETGAEPEAWRYLAVCVPVVVFFGPFGSFLSSHFHRKVLAMFIYVLDTLALVSFYHKAFKQYRDRGKTRQKQGLARLGNPRFGFLSWKSF